MTGVVDPFGPLFEILSPFWAPRGHQNEPVGVVVSSAEPELGLELAPLLRSVTIRVICVVAISEFLELNTICLMCFCYSYYYYYYYSKSIGALRRKGRRRLGTAQNGGGRCSPRRGVQLTIAAWLGSLNPSHLPHPQRKHMILWYERESYT